MVWIEPDGQIRRILNSTHPEPTTLTNTPFTGLFVDNFASRFHQACNTVIATGHTQDFTCLVNFRGDLEARRCRILINNQDLIIINYAIRFFTKIPA